jgi:acetyl-CoA carboxylase carboxyl transferase subunit alpha
MKITAPDLLRFGIIDAIVPEPAGGAHTDHLASALAVQSAVAGSLAELDGINIDRLVDERALRYRAMGEFQSVA